MSSGFEHSYNRALYWIRRKPAAAAGAAGAIGIVCGGLAVGMWADASSAVNVAQRKPVETVGSAGPVKQEASLARAETSATTPQPAVTASADKSAATEEKVASSVNADDRCARQTWPYITQDCLTEPAGQRRVRVITTDKLAAPMISAIETSRAQGAHTAGKAVEGSSTAQSGIPAPATIAPPPGAAKPIEAQVPAPDTKMSSAAAAEQSSRDRATAAAADANAAPTATPAEPLQQRLSAKEARKQARDKRKREAKSRRMPPPGLDDEDSVSRASAFAERDAPARSRIAERWTEREYDVPSYDGTQRRRVIVIRRNNDTSGVNAPSPGSYWRSVFQH